MKNKELENKELEKKLKLIGEKDAANTIKLANDTLPKNEIIPIDFLKLKNEVNKQATVAINNIVNFFFDFDKLDDNSKNMIKSRMNLDIISLHSVIYQLKTSDFAIAQILNELSRGINTNSVRLFEALNSLQRTNIDATKILSSTITTFELQYAQLKKSLDEIMAINNSDENENESRIKRGTKNLFKTISDLDSEIKTLNEN